MFLLLSSFNIKLQNYYRTVTEALTSLHTSMVPNTTWRPSKKLSPMRMTVAPPVVQPSLGLMAFMHGVAAYDRRENTPLRTVLYYSHTHTLTHHIERTHTDSLTGDN